MNRADLQVTIGEAVGDRLPKLQQVAVGMGVVGAAACAFGFALDQKGFFPSYLFAYLFWSGVTMGSLGLLMLHHTVGGGWGFVIRRLLEGAASLLPLMALLFLPVLAGLFWFELYAWTHPKPEDKILFDKVGMLNVPFFLARTAAYFLVLIAFQQFLVRLGNTQDERADAAVSARLNVGSAFGILCFAIVSTFVAVDWVMSLTPHWFSSIYGLFFMASQGLSTLALMLTLIGFLGAESPLVRRLPGTFFRDLANLTLATVMLWAYMAFSQYLITFSGNTVEEISWYLDRNRGGWAVVPALLIVAHFALPFGVLLTNSPMKRTPARLARIALFIVLMRFVDLFWLVTPTFRPQLSISPADFGAPLLLGGIWLWAWAQAIRNRPVVPLHDPRLEPHLTEAPAHA